MEFIWSSAFNKYLKSLTLIKRSLLNQQRMLIFVTFVKERKNS